MAGNTFGVLLRLTSFGESHGQVVGGVLDGFPAGITIDFDLIERDLMRRKPGQSLVSSPRNESDNIEFLAGVFEGKSLGSPIAFVIKNTDTRSGDYDALKDIYRPSHADYTWEKKYGLRDHRGGGRSSARETAVRVAAGALAKMLLKPYGVEIIAWVSGVGPITSNIDFDLLTADLIEANPVRCPDKDAALRMYEYIESLRLANDSTGGIVSCLVRGVPVGLGEPVFDKLQADLGKAMLSINATKGFEYGSGFPGTAMLGSEHNDAFTVDKKGEITTLTNRSGGILGGISNGQPIYFRVAFKPVASIAKEQTTVDKRGNQVVLKVEGRHDPCVVPRAVPIVE
ncbi:MAG TPA: chorismate synthase, partial [Bacteroidales bacterium]|nr:chorismate synthase [Bacteroidales bacterium]